MTDDGEAAGAYELTLADGSLTLASVDEPCPFRLLFLERTWEPAG